MGPRQTDSCEVATTTLDRWCADQSIDRIDVIWMDVQGAELDAFQSGAQARRHTRYVYTEYSDRERYEGQRSLPELLDHLRHLRVVEQFATDVLLENTDVTQSPPQRPGRARP